MYGSERSGIVSGDTSMPLARNSGSYWNAAGRPASGIETAPMLVPHSLTAARVLTSHRRRRASHPPSATMSAALGLMGA